MAWVLCVLLAASTGFLGYLHWFSSASKSSDSIPDSTDPTIAPSKAAPVADEGGVVLESKGYVIAAHQILVSPKVGGMVERLDVVEGMRVQKGDVLATLESTDYVADLNRANAALEAARHRLLELENGNRPEEIEQVKAELAEAITQRDRLRSEFDRAVGLIEDKTITQSEFDEAKTAYEAQEQRVRRLEFLVTLMVAGPRKERVDAARADVSLAEADLVKARWRLDNCTIVAPVSGTILKKNAEEGNIVNPMAFNGSFAICEMADLSDLEVDLSIQERDIARVKAGQKCQVRAEAYPERTYEGYVSRLMPIADRAKGAIPVRVKLSVPRDEEGVYLKPDMGVVVSFLRDPVDAPPAESAPPSPSS